MNEDELVANLFRINQTKQKLMFKVKKKQLETKEQKKLECAK